MCRKQAKDDDPYDHLIVKIDNKSKRLEIEVTDRTRPERRQALVDRVLKGIERLSALQVPKASGQENEMTDISSTMYSRLRKTLMDCGPFENNERLKAAFAHPKLKPWRNSVPEASSRSGRVDLAIYRLLERYNTANQNAMVLFLQVSCEIEDPDTKCHQRLTRLADDLQGTLGDGSPDHRLEQEANPEGQPMAFIAVDERILDCARSVARVGVPRIVGGRMERVPTGTGWLVTPELAFTCWHVVEARSLWDAPISEADLQKQILNSLFVFDYTLPGQGLEYGVAALEYHDPDLDYALLRLKDRPNEPLRNRGFLVLDEDVPLTIQTQLFVIQHPKGQPQQRSAGFFIKKHPSDASRILHGAPTEGGTSGAPVLNVTNWRVVALHNGENQAERLREATLLKAILSNLEQHRPDLHREIMTAQNAKE